MKMFLLAVALFGCTNALACMFKPDSGDNYSVTCSGVVMCKGPIFATATGYTEEKQSCGPCDAGTAATCQQCETDNCNVVNEVEVMECNLYEYDAPDTEWIKKISNSAPTTETCKKLKGEDDICRTPTGTTQNDELDTYCGPCEKGEKCTDNAPAPIYSCMAEQNDGKIASTTCPERSCKGPIFATATGYTGEKHSCGPCDAGTAATCQQCQTDNCNVVNEVEDMKCNTYVWNADDTAWVKAMTEDSTPVELMATCTKFQGEDDICRTPTGTTENDELDTYCGTCEQGAKCSNTAPVVPDCGDDSGARGVTATVLTLIAALFVLA